MPTVLVLYRNVVSAMLYPVLKGEVGCPRCANRRSAANSQRQLEVFVDIFICCASPTGGVRIAAPIVLARIKETKE